MTKIMIVDDDFSVRFNIKRLLDMPQDRTLKNKYIVVGEASDGKEAIELLESVSPDLIISDICMPRMNGIELQEYLLHYKPNIKMIMLSGYDDYEYVRIALKNGALDYLLKHELDYEALWEIIKKIESDVIISSDSSKYRYADSYLTLKRDFIKKIIQGCYGTTKEILGRVKALDLKIGLKNVMVVLMKVQCENDNVKSDYLLEFSILNVVDEILQEAGQGLCCRIADEKYAFLISYENIYSERIRNEQYVTLCGRISSCLKKYLNITVYFYAGKMVNTIAEAKISETSAQEQYNNRYYNEIQFGDIQPFDLLAIFDTEQEMALLTAVRENSYENAKGIIRDIFEQIKKCKATTLELQNLFIDILSTLNRAWKEQSVDISELYKREDIRNRFQDFDSLKTAEEWFLNITQCSFDEERINEGKPNSVYVSKAISYIHIHYLEDISLNDVASEVGISSTYLSKLFKDELNVGFSVFLCNYRIKKAKKLLLQKPLSNKAVAKMCGFQDDAYFARAFKKIEGMTPTEYRRKIKKSNIIKKSPTS